MNQWPQWPWKVSPQWCILRPAMVLQQVHLVWYPPIVRVTHTWYFRHVLHPTTLLLALLIMYTCVLLVVTFSYSWFKMYPKCCFKVQATISCLCTSIMDTGDKHIGGTSCGTFVFLLGTRAHLVHSVTCFVSFERAHNTQALVFPFVAALFGPYGLQTWATTGLV